MRVHFFCFKNRIGDGDAPRTAALRSAGTRLPLTPETSFLMTMLQLKSHFCTWQR